MCESKPHVLIIDSNLKTNLIENATKQPSYVRANLMCSKQNQPSNLPRLRRLESLLPLLYTHGTVAKTTGPIPSPHSRSRYTRHNRYTWNASYSSALSTRRCHHPSVRCWRRVQDTTGLIHPRIQRGVTVASCGARCDRPSASRARM